MAIKLETNLSAIEKAGNRVVLPITATLMGAADRSLVDSGFKELLSHRRASASRKIIQNVIAAGDVLQRPALCDDTQASVDEPKSSGTTVTFEADSQPLLIPFKAPEQTAASELYVIELTYGDYRTKDVNGRRQVMQPIVQGFKSP